MSAPAVAVEPAELRTHLRAAVTAGGGRLVGPRDAEGLVWTGSDGAGELAALLDANPQIRWVQLIWAGIEPFIALVGDGRTWTSGKGVYAKPVAEHALALGLAGLRDLPRRAAARTWEPQGGVSLIGGTVTIFGGGGITEELLKLLAPFEATVTVVRKRPQPLAGAARVLSFDARFDAIAGADLIVLALALTEETTGLFGRVEFEVMEPHAWLVNVARGGHVNTQDLVIALREDIIGGAALDVTDPEPIPDHHPLWSLPNCLITPHTANTESMAVPLVSARVTENVRRYAAGEPLIGVVDADLRY